MKIIQFFKNAFADMKTSTKAQREEAKMSPKARQAKMQEEREKQIAEANERKAIADERIRKAKQSK